jgi:predicted small metal-binding protein
MSAVDRRFAVNSVSLRVAAVHLTVGARVRGVPSMLMEVTCRCGWSTRGSKSEVIKTIQAHARTEHHVEVSPQEIRAIWRVVEDGPPAGQRRNGQT